MRKIIMLGLIAATAWPGMAMAQYAGPRHDRHDIRQEHRDPRPAYRHGDRRDVRDTRHAHRDNWRRDDWRDYRRNHRDVYRGGNWRAPFRYTAWNTGARLKPAYYHSRYRIADPHRYRLPRAGADLRWVRHYNDVLLVNVRTGRVMEVHRGFFW
ncbi:MAG: RcnB family protein [Sphingobium sp.]